MNGGLYAIQADLYPVRRLECHPPLGLALELDQDLAIPNPLSEQRLPVPRRKYYFMFVFFL